MSWCTRTIWRNSTFARRYKSFRKCSPNRVAAFPSKLPNILAAGCPVLAICDPASDLAHFITQASVGAIAVSWDGHELMSKLRLVLDQSVVQKREARQAAVSDMLLTKFSLEKLLDTILGPAPQRTEWVESPVVVP